MSKAKGGGLTGSGVPRSLLVVACLVVAQDLAFFAAISPLLPSYVDDLGLSETEAGVLIASYAAGALLAGLPGGFMASRIGPRVTMISGLSVFAAAGLLFGLADTIVLADAARFLQGVGSALSWAGAFAWVLASDSGERRGALIGTLLGVAIAGALVGPAIGALAAAVGTEYVFGSVVVGAAVLIAVALRVPEAEVIERDRVGEVARALVSGPLPAAGMLLLVPSLLFGAVGVLFPLEIDALGGGALLIAASFTAGAALEAMLSPLIGRYTDRRPWIAPYLSGLLICALAALLIWASGALGVVVACVILTSLGGGVCFAPAFKAVSEAAESSGLHQGMAAGVANISWAGGEAIGSLSGGAIADSHGLASAFLAAAVFLVVSAAIAWRAAPAPRPAT